MKRKDTFAEACWDFMYVRDIAENQTYLFLRLYPAADLNCDGRVDLLDFVIFADDRLAGA